MKISRRNFVKGCAVATGALALSSQVQAAPPRPGGRQILPMPDIPEAAPVARYGKEVTYQQAKPLRPPEGAPNVVIILIDDMGFGASSAFGGPINMPAMESVAADGLKYTRFHTTALCSPSRQALLTGRNHHSVGMGNITECASTAPGYNSIRPNSAATIQETLRLNGYSTAAFGKMHQTPVWEVSRSGPFDRWPTGEGFEYFYGFVGAETNQWAPTLYEGTQAVEPPADPDYHLTPDLVKHATEWVQAEHALTPDKPFFVYLSFGATHAPHHVPPEWSDKYKGKFDQGWDKVREETLARQKKLGVVPEDCQLTTRSREIPAWADLDDDAKKVATRLMEVYAGFAEHTDYYAGQFLDALEKMGVLDNTLVFYIAGDNGASAEGLEPGSFNEMITLNYLPSPAAEDLLARYDDFGTVRAYNHYPVGWAHAMDCPYQWTKQVASHWGGTRNGMAVRWPKGFKAKGEVRNQFHHVIDIAPTILEAAGLPEPVQVHGVTQKPIEGVSMAYTFDDPKAAERHVTQYFEMFGNRGIYHQGWSAVTIHAIPFRKEPASWEQDVWELYDGSTDWSQAVNVADKHPEKLAELKELFLIEAGKYNVFPLDDRRTQLTNAEVAGRPDLLGGRTSMTFYPGMTQLMENTVPNVKNKSHTVTADIEVPEEGVNGVIVAQGGRFGGWSLYLKDGVLKYSHNYIGLELYPVVATEPLAAGRVTVQYKFTYDGGDPGAGGTGELYVGKKKVGEAHIEKTVPYTFSLDETLDIGCDLATPVTDDYPMGDNGFNGKIHSVIVDIGKNPVAYYEPPENIYNRLMANQ